MIRHYECAGKCHRGKAVRMDGGMNIREARAEDAEKLLSIYSHYVQCTAVSFETSVPTISEFEKRIRKTKEKYPYLVCTLNDEIVGYAYAGEYSAREAYAWTATASIYVDRNHHRMGIGSLLYTALEEKLKSQGIVNLLAGVAYIQEEDEYLTHESCRFHLHMGYTQVAHMKGIGKKFDRWYDLLWMQKKL